MKRLLVMLVALLSITFTCHANDQEIVDSFRNFTGNIISEIQASYNRGDSVVAYSKYDADLERMGIKTNYYYKFGYTNLQSSIDVQKTDSLVSPYLGILNIEHQIVQYHTPLDITGQYSTKEEAERANIPTVNPRIKKYQFFYAYQNGSWELKQAKTLYPDGRWKIYPISPLSVCMIHK